MYILEFLFFSYYDSYWNDSFIPEQYEFDVTKIRSSQLYASFSGSYESPDVRNMKMNETISSLKNKIKILIKFVLYLLLFSKKMENKMKKTYF